MEEGGTRTLTDSCMATQRQLLTRSRAAIRSLSELALSRYPRTSDTAIAFSLRLITSSRSKVKENYVIA